MPSLLLGSPPPELLPSNSTAELLRAAFLQKAGGDGFPCLPLPTQHKTLGPALPPRPRTAGSPAEGPPRPQPTLCGARSRRCTAGSWVLSGRSSRKAYSGGRVGSGKLVLVKGSVSSRNCTRQSSVAMLRPCTRRQRRGAGGDAPQAAQLRTGEQQPQQVGAPRTALRAESEGGQPRRLLQRDAPSPRRAGRASPPSPPGSGRPSGRARRSGAPRRCPHAQPAPAAAAPSGLRTARACSTAAGAPRRARAAQDARHASGGAESVSHTPPTYLVSHTHGTTYTHAHIHTPYLPTPRYTPIHPPPTSAPRK